MSSWVGRRGSSCSGCDRPAVEFLLSLLTTWHQGSEVNSLSRLIRVVSGLIGWCCSSHKHIHLSARRRGRRCFGGIDRPLLIRCRELVVSLKKFVSSLGTPRKIEKITADDKIHHQYGHDVAEGEGREGQHTLTNDTLPIYLGGLYGTMSTHLAAFTLHGRQWHE